MVCISLRSLSGYVFDPGEEYLNKITSVNPVSAPGKAPEESKPGATVKPVVQARVLIMIHQPAQLTSLLSRNHWAMPTPMPTTGPIRMAKSAERKTTKRM
jgi:hypothetical protein